VKEYGTARQTTDNNITGRRKYARMQTHSEYVTLIPSPRQPRLRPCPSMLGYMYVVCFFMFSNAFNFFSGASGSVGP